MESSWKDWWRRGYELKDTFKSKSSGRLVESMPCQWSPATGIYGCRTRLGIYLGTLTSECGMNFVNAFVMY